MQTKKNDCNPFGVSCRFLCFIKEVKISLRTYKDCLDVTERLAENHFLSQLEPDLVTKVRAVNTYLCRDQRITDLLSDLYNYSVHTLEHLFNTQITACFLCIKGRLNQETTDYILASALLHDIGKLMIPSSILSKPGSLSASEWKTMEYHPLYSAQLLNSLGLSKMIITMVKYHHISYNKTGYPTFDSLLLEWGSVDHAIIWTSLGYLAMADAFDAMYHQRSYRPTYHVTKIHAEITSCISNQFAPRPADFILNALSNLLKREEFVIC